MRRNKKTAMRILLLEGDPNGALQAEIAGCQGVLYKIPRQALDRCELLGVKDLCSVYFLLGKMHKKPMAYIGQADKRKDQSAILTRLREHAAHKDFWEEALVFTSKNNEFGPTELNFLESRFCAMVKQARQYKLVNAVQPTLGNITEMRKAELEPYVNVAETMLKVLGYPLLCEEPNLFTTSDATPVPVQEQILLAEPAPVQEKILLLEEPVQEEVPLQEAS